MSGSGFFFNDTAPTEIYTLSLHDSLPICPQLKRDPLGGTSHPTSTHSACEEYQLAASCRQRSGVDAGLQRRVGRGLVCFHAPGMGGGGHCDWAYIALDCRSVVSLGRANREIGRAHV